jgi:hypothetical protein
LVGNLSEGFSVPMIYANFDDAIECNEGVECWIMTLDGEDLTYKSPTEVNNGLGYG